jgi:hypothetical protein
VPRRSRVTALSCPHVEEVAMTEEVETSKTDDNVSGPASRVGLVLEASTLTAWSKEDAEAFASIWRECFPNDPDAGRRVMTAIQTVSH